MHTIQYGRIASGSIIRESGSVDKADGLVRVYLKSSLAIVVLPEPVCPTIAVVVPGATSKLTFFKPCHAPRHRQEAQTHVKPTAEEVMDEP